MGVNLVQWLLAQGPAEPLPSWAQDNRGLLLGGGAVSSLFLIVVIVWLSRGKKKTDPEAGLIENLAEYPPAPAGAPKRLLVQNQPGRLRLVVVAPVGRRTVEVNEIEGMLDELVPGLGAIIRQDRPRIRVWPPQLSQQGFGPTFGRLTHRPEPVGKPSPWVLAAGPAKAQGQPILVGLAIKIEQARPPELIQPGTKEWDRVLRIG